MNRRLRKSSYEYRRILEILEDYWLSEPDEKLVVIDMHFEKEGGETQDKRIVWRNPRFPSACPSSINARDLTGKEKYHE